VGVALIAATAGLAGIIDSRYEPGDVVDAVGFVLVGTLSAFSILAVICFVLGFSKFSKRIVCHACNTTGKIPDTNPEIGYLPQTPPPIPPS
jgi:hypothetical protein